MTKTAAKRQETKSNTENHMSEAAEALKVTCEGTTTIASGTCKVTYVEPVNERELTSIYALLAYVAHHQNVRQDTVQMIVEAEFGVDDVSRIRKTDYMNAVEFLVDLKMDEIIN